MVEAGEAAHGAGQGGGTGRPPTTALIVGVVVLLLVGAAGAGWFLRGDDAPGDDHRDPAAAFVADYTASLDRTYRAEGEFTRTMPDGRQLTSGWLLVNRPPDRLQRSLGSTSGVVAGRTVNCGPAGEGYRCALGAEAEPWEDRRAEQLTALEQYVGGTDPVYDVEDLGGGCYELVRRRTEPTATFGLGGEVCLDPSTGAVRRLRVEREGGAVDEMVAVVVRGEVDDADFDLSEDATYDPAQTSGG